MGNSCCKPDIQEDGVAVKQIKRPTWKSEKPLTEADLQRMRDEFWDTEPYYGGDRVIWDALKAASETDLDTAKVILDSAGIIVANEYMTVCYDERGSRYVLPKYVLNYPTNMIQHHAGDNNTTNTGGTELVNRSHSNRNNNSNSNSNSNNSTVDGLSGPQVQLATR